MFKWHTKALVAAVGALMTATFGLLAASAAGTNMVGNPSMETVNGTSPTGWSQGSWGTNTHTFSYPSTGCEDGTRCVSVTMSGYSSGDAKWFFTPVTAAPNTTYTFSDWYKSSVATEVDAVVTDSTGKDSYIYVASPAASSAWKQQTLTFKTPANAAKVTIYHLIQSNGNLTVDNYSLTNGAAGSPSPSASASASPTPTATATVTPTPTATPTPSVTPSPTPSPTATPTPSPTATPTPSPTPTPTPSPSASPSPSPSGTPGNIVPNPGLETANGSVPLNWSADNWGSNTPSFQYLNTGHSGGHSVKVTVSGFSSGAANWTFTPQNVSPGNYQFTDWYQSSVGSEVDAAVTMSDGSTQYLYVTNVLPSSGWAQAKGQVTVPAGAKQITVYHLLAANGSLTTDDYSFAPYTPAPFNRGVVSVTIDDGWTNQYTNGLPILSKYGVPSTFYIISGSLTDQPDYMTGTQVKNLAAAGHEIGSHTVTHPDLTTLNATKLNTELQQSQTTLQNLLGTPVVDFAYPLGAYNATTIAAAQKYYQTQRTVDDGYNTKDSFSPTTLKVKSVFTSTTTADVQSWITQAAHDKTWLILVYHEIANSPNDPSDADYYTTPAKFDTEMSAVKNSGLGIDTVRQAMNEITPQIGH